MKENQCQTDRRRGGFTLAELLIVVAIIGVLAAVAVPMFAGTLTKSQETVCLYNRIVLQRDLTYQAMTEQLVLKDLTAAQLTQLKEDLKTAQQNDSAYCPTGGEYFIKVDPKTGSISVGCNKHTDKGMTNQAMAESSIQDFLDSYTGPKDQSNLLKNYYKYIKENNNGSAYTISQDEVLSLFEPARNADKPVFRDIAADEELIWLPVRLYWGGEAHDVSMATSTAVFKDGQNVCRGYLFSYEGEYYRTTNTDGMKTGYNMYYLPSTPSDGNRYNSLDEFVAGKGKWEKVP